MAELEEQLEFPKQLLDQFMMDYQRCGKYNLAVQVPHLEKLAGFYERKYEMHRHWTDCVKAHALYKSISARDPKSQIWRHRAYQLQQEYWADNCSVSFEQQQTLTNSLKDDLESIRTQSRTDMLTADKLARCFDEAAVTSEQNSEFFSHMRDISIDCSEKMASFASRIIRECVQILKPTKPPCDFEAIAIGSIARGEATPYSDLEFFFLVGNKSNKAVAYLEMLAVTTYFQITNLEETKLSYMAIKELKGWFDDKSKNGFKIDGLSDQAGNIPTGNGSRSQHNHFIVTPDDMAKRYQKILQNPDKEEALRGDLTAMLSYIKLLYSHHSNKESLISKLTKQTGKLTMNQKRCIVNLEMLDNDVKKFNFKPSEGLLLNGFAADVKKEIYRFPSILLLDITIVTQTSAPSSWESLQKLKERDEISDEVHFVLALLLASATFMRMSAYLHHDSQDDRMSVCQQTADLVTYQDHIEKSSPQSRWFVPSGLFITMCSKMVILKRNIAKSNDVLSDLKTLVLAEDEFWSRITSLFYTGRYYEVLGLLEQAYGEKVSHDPLSVTRNIQSEQDKSELCYIITETLFQCKKYRAALVIYEQLTDWNFCDRRKRTADCYRRLGDYDKALRILESITDKSADEHYSLGIVYFFLKKYDKAELSYLQALELSYFQISSEHLFDHYGNPILKSNKPIGMQKVDLASVTPVARLSRITNASSNVIHYVGSLGLVYRRKGQYELSKNYYEKTLDLITGLYGHGAVVPASAHTMYNLGSVTREMGRNSEAEYYYKQALAVYGELSQGADSTDIADTLTYLGYNYEDTGYESRARETFTEALNIYIRVDPDHPNIRGIRYHLMKKGDDCNKKGKFTQAEDHYKLALCGYGGLSSPGELTRSIGEALNSLGVTYNKMRQYSDAEDYYQQALAVYRAISHGADSSDIANTLTYLGYNYRDAGYESESIATFIDALDMYIRVDADNPIIRGIRYRLIEKGDDCSRKGKLTQAENYYKLALSGYGWLSLLGDFSTNVGVKLNNLGNNYHKIGQYSEAEEYYRRALVVYRHLSQIADRARTLNNLGNNYNKMGRYSQAKSYYNQALAIYRDVSYGGDISNLARTLDNLGVNYSMMEQYSEAEDNHKHALAIYRELSQCADVRDVARALDNIGINYNKMGRYCEAESFYKQALDKYRELSKGADSSDIADTLSYLGYNDWDAGDESRAKETYRKALDMYIRVDPDNPMISKIRDYIFKQS